MELSVNSVLLIKPTLICIMRNFQIKLDMDTFQMASLKSVLASIKEFHAEPLSSSQMRFAVLLENTIGKNVEDFAFYLDT